MNAKQIYAMKPLRTSNDFSDLYDHMIEISQFEHIIDDTDDNRIEIKTVAYHHEDYERGVTLSTAWCMGIPFMVMQNAGRGGKDHVDRFITNVNVYYICAKFIMDKELHSSMSRLKHDIIDENEDNPRLINFYGYKLDTSKIDG